MGISISIAFKCLDDKQRCINFLTRNKIKLNEIINQKLMLNDNLNFFDVSNYIQDADIPYAKKFKYSIGFKESSIPMQLYQMMILIAFKSKAKLYIDDEEIQFSQEKKENSVKINSDGIIEVNKKFNLFMKIFRYLFNEEKKELKIKEDLKTKFKYY